MPFLLVVHPDGDLALGFDGYSCHTLADILAARFGLPAAEVVHRFIDDLLGDRSVIAWWDVPDVTRDA